MTKTKIIVVEDERIVALNTKQQLTKLGYDVVALVAAGAEALQKIAELRPDLILMDIHIEGDADGIEIAGRVSLQFDIPVIYVTAYSEPATLERARETCPYGYLVKPYSEPELHATIQMALERHRADSALKISQTQIKQERDMAQRYLDIAGVMILVLDLEGKVTLINRRGASILGYDDPNEIIGKPWVENFVPQRLRPVLREAFQRLLGGEQASLEFNTNAVLTKGGGERIVAWHNLILKDEGGRVTGSLCSGEDITERVRVEDNLRLSEARFRSIFGAVSEGIFIVDAGARTFLEVNDAGCAIFGYAPGDLIGRDINALSSGIPPYTQKEAEDWIRKAAGEGPQTFDWHCRTKDGRLFWAELSIRFASIGGSDAVLATVRDMTERRVIEEQLRQAQKMEAIGQLTGGMAHDFNNLLGVIVGNLDLLRAARPNDKEIIEMADEAMDAALSGADLTRGLLAFARRQPLQPERIDLNALVKSSAKLLRRVLGENIEISLHFGEQPSIVLADPAQLEAALTNLATNARDAMPRGGKLMIGVGRRRLDRDYAVLTSDVAPGDYALIEVTDTGSGMTPEVIKHIFEPFYTTKGREQGTGLGLSMVFGFIKQSGGHISVYSEVGTGTTFRLYLPITQAPATSKRELQASDLGPAKGEMVLVVEDNPQLLRAVVRQLRELGYRVLEAKNGADALEQLKTNQVDLLFTDVVMPGKFDGFGLARKAKELWPSTKVLLTSGFPETKLKEEFRSAELRLLSKPYRKEDLRKVLREVIEAPCAGSEKTRA